MRIRLIAWSTFLFALSLWGVFGYLAWALPGERSEYARGIATADADALRGESLARVRAIVRDTDTERSTLESIFNLTILRAVEILETTGRQAGAKNVSIGEATPSSLGANAPKGLSAVTIVVKAEGPFPALIRAVNLYESLAIPATLEQFEMEKIESTWHMTVRFRILLSSSP